MNNPKPMNEYFRQSFFTDDELIYAYNFMDTLQKMLMSLGTEYNAIWRIIFSDMRMFEEMMLHRNNMVSNCNDLFESRPVPVGQTESVRSFTFDVTVGVHTCPSHIRNQLIQNILKMSDEEITLRMHKSGKVEEVDENILNAFQDNL